MADPFTLPINHMPNPGPLNNILPNSTTIAASIVLLLEETPLGLTANRPPPLSGEPGPQIDYRLLRVILSITRDLLPPEVLHSISCLAAVRRKYFAAHNAYMHIYRHIQDLWAQRLQLVDRANRILASTTSTTTAFNGNGNEHNHHHHNHNHDQTMTMTIAMSALLHQNAQSQLANVQDARATIEKFYMCANGVAKLAGTFVQTKEETMPSIYLAQNVLLEFWGPRLTARVDRSNSSSSSVAQGRSSGPAPAGDHGGNVNSRKRDCDEVVEESEEVSRKKRPGRFD